MLEDSSNDSVVRIVLVAKYPIYMQSVENLLPKKTYQLKYFRSYSELVSNEPLLSEVDYFFFPHSSEIIPTDFLKAYNCIGFHTGDLPNDRGGSPIQHKIRRGEYLTKVSAIRLTERIDGGEVYLQRDIDLTFGSIEAIIQEISNIVAGMIHTIVKDKPLPVRQPPGGTISRRLVRSDSRFCIDDLSHRQIYDHIRMLDGLDYPKANMVLGRHVIFLSEAKFDTSELTFKCTIRIGDDDATQL